MVTEIPVLVDNGKIYKLHSSDSRLYRTDLGSTCIEARPGLSMLIAPNGLPVELTSDGRYKFIDNGIEVIATLIDQNTV